MDLDVARILLCSTFELATTDISSHNMAALEESSIRKEIKFGVEAHASILNHKGASFWVRVDFCNLVMVLICLWIGTLRSIVTIALGEIVKETRKSREMKDLIKGLAANENIAINFDDEESRRCFLADLVIRSHSISTSNWRSAETLGSYLAKRNIMGI
ncbi:hypothetical protein Droror1_Dr00024608, partial [Drosera rotundifolia]